MKVVIQGDSRGWGGNEKWLLMVGQGLAARGHQVIISCHRGGPIAERARAAGLRVTHHRPGGDADLPRALGFARLLRRERPDAVLLTALKRAFWAGWACHTARVPRVVERVGIELDLPARWKYRKPFRDWIHALIVNSSAIRARWLRSAPWFPAEEVHVVLNGVHPPSLSASTLRAELDIRAETPVIAAAGWLEHRKGFDVLLAALAAAAHPAARLVIAGAGPDADSLRAQAAALGIADRVHWLGFRADLENVLLGADVFALPSRREGMANVMLEAMAAGCLVIASDVSGVRDALAPRAGRPGAGWIAPPGDVGALAAAVDQALAVLATGGARPLLDELHWRARHWFNPERTVAETERVLLGKAGKGEKGRGTGKWKRGTGDGERGTGDAGRGTGGTSDPKVT